MRVERAFSEALEAEEWRRSELVAHLHLHGGREALDIAGRLGHDPQPSHRELAADVLGQLGVQRAVPGGSPGRSPSGGPFRDEATALLLAMIEHEEDPVVLRSLAVGLGHMAGEDSVAPLLRLRAHPDPDVRGGVVSGLLTRESRAALDALVELSADPETDVRDWATFGLARQTEQDFPELRDALAARLGDDDPDILAEAVHGLAVRGDERAMPQLLRHLSDPDEGADQHIIFEALCALAAATADPRLLPFLEAERGRYTGEPPDEALLGALARYGR